LIATATAAVIVRKSKQTKNKKQGWTNEWMRSREQKTIQQETVSDSCYHPHYRSRRGFLADPLAIFKRYKRDLNSPATFRFQQQSRWRSNLKTRMVARDSAIQSA
jgi:hypothetical protein